MTDHSSPNNGTSNTDYVTQIAARTATQGYGPFRGGAAQGTSYADFDQSYDPINGFDAQATATNYVVKPGDTLQSIARQLWGDANLWYLIGNANGLTADAHLAVGMNIVIPNNQVHNFHNNSTTFKVYDPNLGIGDVSPTAPEIPPPPPPPVAATQGHHGGGCGIFGQIILAVVAVVVTALTFNPVAGALVSTLGSTGAAVAGGAIAATAGSIVSQGVGLATGIQKSFNWGGVAMAAIGGAIGGAVAPGSLFGKAGAFDSWGEIGGAVARGVAGSLVGQGIDVAVGLQKSFDWAGVAAAGVGAGVGQFVSENLPGAAQGSIGTPNYIAASQTNVAISGTARMIANAATRSLVNGSDFGDNIIAALPDTIGQTVGNMVASRVTEWANSGSGADIGPGTSPATRSQSAALGGANSDDIQLVTSTPSVFAAMAGGLNASAAASSVVGGVAPTPETINVTANALTSSEKAAFDIAHPGWWNNLYPDEVQLASRAGISQRARTLATQSIARAAAPRTSGEYISDLSRLSLTPYSNSSGLPNLSWPSAAGSKLDLASARKLEQAADATGIFGRSLDAFNIQNSLLSLRFGAEPVEALNAFIKAEPLGYALIPIENGFNAYAEIKNGAPVAPVVLGATTKTLAVGTSVYYGAEFGAGVGFAVGGPPGALIGGAIGGAAAGFAADYSMRHVSNQSIGDVATKALQYSDQRFSPAP